MSERVTKLGDIKGPQSLEVFAELLPMIFNMADDKETMEFFTAGATLGRAEALTKIINIVNKHKEAFYIIEAAKRNIPVAQCKNELSIDGIFDAVTELMTDPLFRCFFGLTRMDATSPISAPGNTEEAKE